MNINVARKLHERRFRPSPTMTTGELINLIGSDGMQEAMNKRWLVPDMDSGFLMLNLNGGKLAELESACVCACGKTDCGCVEKLAESMTTMPMREAFAAFGVARPGGVTGGSAPAMPAPMLPRPQTPTSHVDKPAKAPNVGDPAVVEQDGQTYTGEISGFEPDGRVRLRWKGSRPAQDRPYGPNEFLVPDNPAHA